MEEDIRGAEEASSIRCSSNCVLVENPMENNEVLEEILIYALKEGLSFSNAVLGGNQGQ